MKNKALLFTLVFALVAAGIWVVYRMNRTDLTEAIELRFVSENEKEVLLSKEITLTHFSEIQEFYENRGYEEIWSSNGKINSQGEDLLNAISEVKYDGLKPSDYHHEFLKNAEAEIQDKKKILQPKSSPELVDFELVMTDAFLDLVYDLKFGIVSEKQRGNYWKLPAKKEEFNPMDALAEVADGGKVEDFLESLYPDLAMYKKGREVLKELYAINEEDTLTWKPVRFEETLKVGDENPAVPDLRKRLQFWGYLIDYKLDNPDLFDSVMLDGLKKYQTENGMKPDGAIGKLTADFLNDSPEKLIEIASVNMERMRWMPEMDWDQEMVLVNIANYQLDYLTKGDTTLSAKVIVGKEYNESPVFTAPMSYIVFSPYWNIPPSITQGEIIPAMQKNKNYLAEKNMEVVSSSGEVVDPQKINWIRNEANNYRIRQKPGQGNSLGLVKFMFPNDYNIYIHDTPARGLFERETRALSHGCIRIQYPDQFAQALLQDDQWTSDKIQEAMHLDREEVVNLNREVPVTLLYLTFWADSNGKAHFRPDIYKRDTEVLKAMKKA